MENAVAAGRASDVTIVKKESYRVEEWVFELEKKNRLYHC